MTFLQLLAYPFLGLYYVLKMVIAMAILYLIAFFFIIGITLVEIVNWIASLWK